jgi:excisionase family DNA binding protein
MNIEKPYYTIAEVAEKLGVHTNTIHNMLKSGRLEAYRIGSRIIRITPAQLKAAIGEQENN